MDGGKNVESIFFRTLWRHFDTPAFGRVSFMEDEEEEKWGEAEVSFPG